MVVTVRSSSRYTYISGLYCGLGIYWVNLSIIYFVFCFCLFLLGNLFTSIALFVHLNLLIIALLNPGLINCLLLSTLCSWGCIYVNLFNKFKSQVPIAYYSCPLICLCIVLCLLVEFRDSLPNVLDSSRKSYLPSA